MRKNAVETRCIASVLMLAVETRYIASVLMLMLLLLVLVACYPTPTPVATVTPSPSRTVTCNPWPTFWPTDLEGPDDWGTMCPVETPYMASIPIGITIATASANTIAKVSRPSGADNSTNTTEE